MQGFSLNNKWKALHVKSRVNYYQLNLLSNILMHQLVSSMLLFSGSQPEDLLLWMGHKLNLRGCEMIDGRGNKKRIFSNICFEFYLLGPWTVLWMNPCEKFRMKISLDLDLITHSFIWKMGTQLGIAFFINGPKPKVGYHQFNGALFFFCSKAYPTSLHVKSQSEKYLVTTAVK